jgi:hypothetical protein
MVFRNDVARIPGLEYAYREGLQALKPPDRARIDPERPDLLRGSVDIDSSLRASAPHAARWDYVVASVTKNPRAERLYLIEVHPATSRANINEVQAKHEWLRNWLGGDGRPLAGYPKDVVWIASGKCAYTTRTPVIKSLASEGIRFAGRKFRIPAWETR